MKILVIYDGYCKVGPTGSVPSVAFHLATTIAQKGHQVTVLERKDSDADPDREDIGGVRYVRLKVRKKAAGGNDVLYNFPFNLFNVVFDGIAWARCARRWLRAQPETYDIIHVHLPLASTVLALLDRKLRHRMVYTFHGDSYRLNLKSRVKVPWFVRLFAPDLVLMRRVAKTIILNKAIRDKLVQSGKVAVDRLAAIGNGIAADRYRPDVDVSDIRADYSADGKLIVLFAGAVFARKGVEYLIRAADLLSNEPGYDKLLFLLAGNLDQDPDYVLRMRTLITELRLEDRVIFTGSLPHDKLARLYVASDLLVCPSPEEPYPTVVLEAMACGRPVVGTRVGGMLEEIVDGETGFLVEPEDAAALAEKIRYLADHPEERRRMGENSRRRVLAKFDWGRIAERYLELFKEVAE